MMTDLSAEPVGHTEVPTDEATLTTFHKLLADKTRCAVLRYLATVDRAVPLDTLVDEVAVKLTSAGVDSQFREKVAIQLHHIHLPKMDDVGVINYDLDEHLIEPTEKIAVPLQLLIRDTASRT